MWNQSNPRTAAGRASVSAVAYPRKGPTLRPEPAPLSAAGGRSCARTGRRPCWNRDGATIGAADQVLRGLDRLLDLVIQLRHSDQNPGRPSTTVAALPSSTTWGLPWFVSSHHEC